MHDANETFADREAEIHQLRQRLQELERQLAAASPQQDLGVELQAVLDGLEDRAAILDEDGRIVVVNAAWRRLGAGRWGGGSGDHRRRRRSGTPAANEREQDTDAGPAKDLDTGLGHDFLDFCTELAAGVAEVQEFAASLRDVVRGRAESVASDIECHVGNGTQWFHVRAAALSLGGQRRTLVTCRDISLTRRVLAAMLDAVVTIDAYGTILSASDSVVQLFGYAPRELQGQNIKVLMPEPHHSRHDEYLARYRATGNTWILGTTREFTVLRKDGSEFVCELSVNRVDVPGETPIFTGSFRDVTRRKRAEQALQESERRLKAIFDQEFQFVGLLQPDGTLLEANRPALEFVGCTREEVVGRPFAETPWWGSSAETRDRLRAAIRDAAAGAFVRYEVDVVGVGGRVLTIDFSLKPVVDEAGEIVLLIPEGRDITELKRARSAEELMLRTLASIGQSAAMLAHELKSPITGINMALQALAQQLGEEHAAILADLVGRLQRLEWMVRRTLGFAKPPELRLQTCTPDALLASVVANLREILQRDRVRIECRIVGEPFTFAADPQRLEEVLASLVLNAAEARGKGAYVRLSARLIGDRVEFMVEDDGPGIAPEMRERLFRPFVTTKPSGTGLGLVICQKIVTQHGGTIEACDSELGGAGFCIRLPATRGRAGAGAGAGAAAAEPAPGSPGRDPSHRDQPRRVRGRDHGGGGASDG